MRRDFPRQPARPWFIRRSASQEPRLRLVCLPPAGGTATFFHSWHRAFAPDIEVLAASYPGHLDRLAEPHITRMADLADRLAEALMPFLDRPIAIFGHSMGAAVAYEVALKLERNLQTKIETLFVSGRQPPHRARSSGLHKLSDDALTAHIRQLGGVNGEVLADPSFRELMLPVMRFDYELLERYQRNHLLKISAPIIALAGKSDPLVTYEDCAAWGDATGDECHVRIFPGGHFYLIPAEAAVFAEVTSRLLARLPS